MDGGYYGPIKESEKFERSAKCKNQPEILERNKKIL